MIKFNLIDEIRKILTEHQVLTTVTLKGFLPDRIQYVDIRLHLLTLLELDEVAVTKKVAGESVVVYVWKGEQS